MESLNNRNMIEIPANDINHCKYCKESLGKRYVIDNSKFFCSIYCLRGFLSFLHEVDFRKNNDNCALVNYLLVILGVIVLILIIKS